MTAFLDFALLLRRLIVLSDPTRGTVRRIVAFQYNPDTLTHTLQVTSERL